jgi:hypothetical protein
MGQHGIIVPTAIQVADGIKLIQQNNTKVAWVIVRRQMIRRIKTRMNQTYAYDLGYGSDFQHG